ncbi:MAG TPA: NTP transferase domain-containing protein [Micromonosporaceae bacterium]
MVLASGGGRKYGGPWALLRHEGTYLVERAARAARDGGCSPIVVVLGANADQVRAEADLGEAVLVDDAGWRTGSGSALRAGLAALADTDAVAALVLLVEMPGVGPEAVRRVADGAQASTLRAATYAGRRSHPVLLGRDHWAGVTTLATGDVGARAYLTARSSSLVAVACDDIADGNEVEKISADG